MSRIRSLLLIIGVFLAACNPRTFTDESDRIQVMATTSIVGDIVLQVGGEYVNVEILLPLGTDPHSFMPTPKDVSRLIEARLVFINGAGLEEFLTPMIQNAGVAVRLVDLSASIPLRQIEMSSSGSDQAKDPHTWMDPNNVIEWSVEVANALIEIDQAHKSDYLHNASVLRSELIDLDQWIHEQVQQIPDERRKLITDHLVFGYFADRYGFIQVGSIIPGFSTMAEPSARELVLVEDTILKQGIPALFVSWSANQDLATRIADDTGIRVIPLFMQSLSAKGGEAEHYQDLIRYNVNAIVAGLK